MLYLLRKQSQTLIYWISPQSYHFNPMPRNRFLPRLNTLLVSLWLLMACATPEDAQPDTLISEARMATILTQIHLAEARVSRIGLATTDSSNVVYKRLEKEVFQKFQVDTSAYTKSYIYYSSHPRQMERIYKQITENLKQQIDRQQKQLHTKKPARS